MKDGARIKKIFEKARTNKTNFDILYRNAMDSLIPEWNTYINNIEGGKREDSVDTILDSGPQIALDKFVSNLQSSIVPPGKKWVTLVAGSDVPDSDRNRVATQLEFICEKIFSKLNNSNFDTQISECFYNLALGSAMLMVQSGESADKPFNFLCVPIQEFFWEENMDSTIGTIFRRHDIKFSEIEEIWGGQLQLSDETRRKIEETPEEKVFLIECTEPADIEVKVHGKVKNALGEEFLETTLENKKGYKYTVIIENNNEIIVQKDMQSSPWVPFRWTVAPGEVWGRGPALKALPTIQSLNTATRLILQNASLAVCGAYTFVDDGITNPNTFKLEPGAFNAVGSNGSNTQGPSIKQMETSARFDIGQIVLKDLQAKINDIFFAEPLGPIDAPVKTATELSLRQQEMAKRIGSSFGRILYELITPLINRLIFLLNEHGIIDLENSLKVDGSVLKLEYISPLSKAQEREELSNLTEYVQTLAGLYGPQVAMSMAPIDRFYKRIAQLLNVPESLLPTDEEINGMKQAIAQQMSVMQQSQQNAVDNGEQLKTKL